MTSKLKNVREYLDALEETKKDKDEQVKQGLEIYIDLWRRAIEKGIVGEADRVDYALVKIEDKGGLYKAAED